jgi:hypothetical protein
MPGVRRFDQKTLRLYEVEIGSLKALFVRDTPVVVFDGTNYIVTSEPATGRIAAQIAGYLAEQESKGFYEAHVYKTVSQIVLNKLVRG